MLFCLLILFVNSRRFVPLKCPLACSKVGLCDPKTGICICPKPFTGTGCELRGCDQNCSGNGTCEDGECLCNIGFTGPTCARGLLSCPNDCTNEIDVPNGQCDFLTGTCKCRAEFGGDDCSIFIGTDDVTCPNDCSGHGVCDLYQGICKCDKDWITSDCSVNIGIAVLCPDNCSQQGTCNYNTGICTCREGFAGLDCKLVTSKCPNNCSSPQGACLGDKGCVCAFPFTGPDCGQNVCDNKELNMCNQNGQCSKNSTFPNGFCECNLGTKWPDCQF